MPKKTEPKDTQSTQPEQVQQIRISDIHPFKNHPFKVVDDALMQETVDSIMQFGVLNPTIIRPDPGGGYEMVAGHRRLHASGLAGKDTIPAIVRNLTDDEAVILLVDTNLQRENISPMERAQAYKMKMEALKHQGQRTDLHKEATSCQVGEKSAWAIAKVSEDDTRVSAKFIDIFVSQSLFLKSRKRLMPKKSHLTPLLSCRTSIRRSSGAFWMQWRIRRTPPRFHRRSG